MASAQTAGQPEAQRPESGDSGGDGSTGGVGGSGGDGKSGRAGTAENMAPLTPARRHRERRESATKSDHSRRESNSVHSASVARQLSPDNADNVEAEIKRLHHNIGNSEQWLRQRERERAAVASDSVSPATNASSSTVAAGAVAETTPTSAGANDSARVASPALRGGGGGGTDAPGAAAATALALLQQEAAAYERVSEEYDALLSLMQQRLQHVGGGADGRHRNGAAAQQHRQHRQQHELQMLLRRVDEEEARAAERQRERDALSDQLRRIADSSAVSEPLRQRLQEARRRKSELDDEVRSLRSSVAAQERDSAALDSAFESVHDAVQREEASVREARERRDEARRELHEIESDTAARRKLLEVMRTQCTDLMRTREQLHHESDAAEDRRRTLAHALAASDDIIAIMGRRRAESANRARETAAPDTGESSAVGSGSGALAAGSGSAGSGAIQGVQRQRQRRVSADAGAGAARNHQPRGEHRRVPRNAENDSVDDGGDGRGAGAMAGAGDGDWEIEEIETQSRHSEPPTGTAMSMSLSSSSSSSSAYPASSAQYRPAGQRPSLPPLPLARQRAQLPHPAPSRRSESKSVPHAHASSSPPPPPPPPPSSSPNETLDEDNPPPSYELTTRAPPDMYPRTPSTLQASNREEDASAAGAAANATADTDTSSVGMPSFFSPRRQYGANLSRMQNTGSTELVIHGELYNDRILSASIIGAAPATDNGQWYRIPRNSDTISSYALRCRGEGYLTNADDVGMRLVAVTQVAPQMPVRAFTEPISVSPEMDERIVTWMIEGRTAFLVEDEATGAPRGVLVSKKNIKVQRKAAPQRHQTLARNSGGRSHGSSGGSSGGGTARNGRADSAPLQHGARGASDGAPHEIDDDFDPTGRWTTEEKKGWVPQIKVILDETDECALSITLDHTFALRAAGAEQRDLIALCIRRFAARYRVAPHAQRHECRMQ